MTSLTRLLKFFAPSFILGCAGVMLFGIAVRAFTTFHTQSYDLEHRAQMLRAHQARISHQRVHTHWVHHHVYPLYRELQSRQVITPTSQTVPHETLAKRHLRSHHLTLLAYGQINQESGTLYDPVLYRAQSHTVVMRLGVSQVHNVFLWMNDMIHKGPLQVDHINMHFDLTSDQAMVIVRGACYKIIPQKRYRSTDLNRHRKGNVPHVVRVTLRN